MRRFNAKPVDRKSFQCPQCKKPRMIRDLDHEVSLKEESHKTKDDKEVLLFVDICDPCKKRNFKKYFEPTKADVRRVLNAMKQDVELDESQSLEELL